MLTLHLIQVAYKVERFHVWGLLVTGGSLLPLHEQTGHAKNLHVTLYFKITLDMEKNEDIFT